MALSEFNFNLIQFLQTIEIIFIIELICLPVALNKLRRCVKAVSKIAYNKKGGSGMCQFSVFYLVLIAIVGCIVALVALFLNKNK
jgi:hypothetical protein